MAPRFLTTLPSLPSHLIVRLDLNLPHYDGKILDPSRLQAILPTLRYLHQHHVRRCVIIAHWGRPKFVQSSFSLRHLNVLFQHYAPEINMRFVEAPLDQLPDTFSLQTGFFLMENLRFYPEEASNDPSFVARLGNLGDFFINEAFSVSHRPHASIVGLPSIKPSAAGLLFERELKTINKLKSHTGTSMIILGGGKVDDKLRLVNCLAEPTYLVLGSSATHLTPQAIASHTHLSPNTRLVMPLDGFDDQRNLITLTQPTPASYALYDVGPLTVSHIQQALDKVTMVLWNGPLGLCEKFPFHQSTVALGRAIAQRTQEGRLISFVGGGETCSVLREAGILDNFTAFSYSGGALLSFLQKGTLPGIDALKHSHASLG